MAAKPVGTKDKFKLTEKQEAFVTAFIGEAGFDKDKAAAIARKSLNITEMKPGKILESEAVQRAIHQRMDTSLFWLNEATVIDRLFKEGINANSASARVNALVWVGKHLGMWKEKEQSVHDGVTYNIVNYAQPEGKMLDEIKATPEVELNKDKAKLPEGVAVLSYSKEG